jgi:hypothetical protein
VSDHRKWSSVDEEFVPDSPLEGDGIRTIGTRRIFLASPSIPPIHLRNINRLPRDDRWFESISLQQRVWNEPTTAGKAQSCA